MNIIETTSEIERFCKHAPLDWEGIDYIPLLLNYNTNVHEEIPEFKDNEQEAIPVLIVKNNKDDLSLSRVYIPGFRVTNFDKEGKITSEVLEIAMTQSEYIRYHNYNMSDDEDKRCSLEEQALYTYVEILGYNSKYSSLLENYLGQHGASLETFMELVCFYPELNELTLIGKRYVEILKDEKVGVVLNSFKFSEDASSEIKGLTTIIKRYFNNNIKVFRVLSSTGKKNPMNKDDVLHSSNSINRAIDMAFHTNNDPVKDKVGERVTPNTFSLLPTFDKRVLQEIMVGNFPFMVLYSESVEGKDFNNDPLNYVKNYIIQKSRMIISLLKSADNKASYLTKDEIFILDNSNTVLHSTKIRSLYNTVVKKDTKAAPGTLHLGSNFTLYYINFSQANIVLKNTGAVYAGRIEQMLNILLPINLA